MKDYESQLGWLFPIYGKIIQSCSKPPTSPNGWSWRMGQRWSYFGDEHPQRSTSKVSTIFFYAGPHMNIKICGRQIWPGPFRPLKCRSVHPRVHQMHQQFLREVHKVRILWAAEDKPAPGSHMCTGDTSRKRVDHVIYKLFGWHM